MGPPFCKTHRSDDNVIQSRVWYYLIASINGCYNLIREATSYLRETRFIHNFGSLVKHILWLKLVLRIIRILLCHHHHRASVSCFCLFILAVSLEEVLPSFIVSPQYNTPIHQKTTGAATWFIRYVCVGGPDSLVVCEL